jgi:hypothetical protein
MTRDRNLAGTIGVALALALVIGAVGCSSIKVESIHDNEYDFEGTTYMWAEQDIPRSADLPYELIDRVVKEALNDQMSSKGFTLVTSGSPDYVLLYYVGEEQITRVNTTTYPGYYGGYRGGPGRRGGWGRAGWGGYGGGTTTVSQYDEGSLTIDILDGESEELIWRGTAKATVKSGDSSEQRRQKVDEVALKLLAKFPPQ